MSVLNTFTFAYEYIKDEDYLDEIKKREEELENLREKYKNRPTGFIGLGYAKAIYEIEKCDEDNHSSIIHTRREDPTQLYSKIHVYISDKYKITPETREKLTNFLKFKYFTPLSHHDFKFDIIFKTKVSV